MLAWVYFIAAGCLMLWYAWVDARAGWMAQGLLEQVQAQTNAGHGTPTPASEGQQNQPVGDVSSNGNVILNATIPTATLSAEMPVVEVDGNQYVGQLQIAPLGLSLPILAQASNAGLKIAPCRVMGSSREENLVVAGHNYQRHFGKLKTLVQDDVLALTDMDGMVHTYTVASVQEVAATAVETVCRSEYPLVLYTCTLGGARRVVVFCQNSDTVLDRDA